MVHHVFFRLSRRRLTPMQPRQVYAAVPPFNTTSQEKTVYFLINRISI